MSTPRTPGTVVVGSHYRCWHEVVCETCGGMVLWRRDWVVNAVVLNNVGTVGHDREAERHVVGEAKGWQRHHLPPEHAGHRIVGRGGGHHEVVRNGAATPHG